MLLKKCDIAWISIYNCLGNITRILNREFNQISSWFGCCSGSSSFPFLIELLLVVVVGRKKCQKVYMCTWCRKNPSETIIACMQVLIHFTNHHACTTWFHLQSCLGYLDLSYPETWFIRPSIQQHWLSPCIQICLTYPATFVIRKIFWLQTVSDNPHMTVLANSPFHVQTVIVQVSSHWWGNFKEVVHRLFAWLCCALEVSSQSIFLIRFPKGNVDYIRLPYQKQAGQVEMSSIWFLQSKAKTNMTRHCT